MAFEKMGSFTFNHADQADELNLAADTAKQKFDSRANELKTAFNKVVDLLNATTDGASGADNVGATAISGVTGTTVQAQMKSMKGLVDGKAASGHNHDSSYSSASHNHDSSYAPIDLAGTGRTIETVKGNADDLKTHLADDAYHLTTGAQTFTGTKTIASLIANGALNGAYAYLKDGGGATIFSKSNSLILLYAVDKTTPANYIVAIGYKGLQGTDMHVLNIIKNNVLTLGASNTSGTQNIDGGDPDNILFYGISIPI